MLEFNNFVTGYEPAALALVFVFAYFVLIALMLRIPGSQHISVPRYEPPPGASPGVAAWLLERGKLSRAIAAALVNMAAKGYLKIEQTEDFVSLTQLATETSAPLEPEEDVLARSLFRGYDCFDFTQTTPQLAEAVKAFRWALFDTQYFSPHTGLSIPAWTVSILATLFALARGNYFAKGPFPYSSVVILMTFGCFIVAVHTLPGPLEKIASHFPGSIAPRRPWTGADSRPITFLLATLGGVSLLAVMSTTVAALLTTAFLAVNAVFFYALQGPTSAGRGILAQLDDYKKFLSEVDADAISRVNSPEHPPAQLHTKDANSSGGFFSGLKDKFLDFLARNANYLPGVCTAGAFGFGTGGVGNDKGGLQGGVLIDKQIGQPATTQPIGEVGYGPVWVGQTPSETLVFVEPAPKVPVGVVYAANPQNGFINNSGISIGFFAGKAGSGKGLAGGFGGGAYLTFSSAANCLKNF